MGNGDSGSYEQAKALIVDRNTNVFPSGFAAQIDSMPLEQQRKFAENALYNATKGKTIHKTIDGNEVYISFIPKQSKHAIGDALAKHLIPASQIATIPQLIANSNDVTSGELTKDRNDGKDKFYYVYTNVNGRRVCFNIAHETRVFTRGKKRKVVTKEYTYLYAIT